MQIKNVYVQSVGKLFFLLIVLGLYFARRPDQLHHPYIWVEESNLIYAWQTKSFFEAVLSPVNGYLVLSNSLPISIASEIDFLNLPRLLFYSATTFMLITILLIVSSKSYFGNVKYFLALAVVLSPANPEVFAVTGYSFWWTQLWPLLILFNRQINVALSATLLLVSGLSGLTAGIFSILYFIRWRQKKDSRYALYFAILAVSLIIQFSILISSPRLGNLTLDLSDVTIQFFRNYGYYAIAWVDGVASDFLAVAGIAVLASLVFIIRESDVLKDRDIAFILKATLFASIVFTLSTSVIVPLQTSPGLNGPRYYFLTFVLISFILLISTAVKTENLTQNRLVISSASMILIAMSLLTLSVNWNRFHVEINWPDEVRAACTRNFQDRQVPIHFDGNTETTWKMRLTKSTCDNL